MSKNRHGRGPYRKRVDEILFIDARKKGVMVNRRQRVLTDEEIAEIAAVYNTWRKKDSHDEYEDVPGFCKAATLDEVRAHDYKLTPGIYVGAEQNETDDTPFEVKMAALVAELETLFAESNALQERIVRELEGLMQ